MEVRFQLCAEYQRAILSNGLECAARPAQYASRETIGSYIQGGREQAKGPATLHLDRVLDISSWDRDRNNRHYQRQTWKNQNVNYKAQKSVNTQR